MMQNYRAKRLTARHFAYETPHIAQNLEWDSHGTQVYGLARLSGLVFRRRHSHDIAENAGKVLDVGETEFEGGIRYAAAVRETFSDLFYPDFQHIIVYGRPHHLPEAFFQKAT